MVGVVFQQVVAHRLGNSPRRLTPGGAIEEDRRLAIDLPPQRRKLSANLAYRKWHGDSYQDLMRECVEMGRLNYSDSCQATSSMDRCPVNRSAKLLRLLRG